MLGDSQKQIVDGGSAAIQAGRDINIHGLSVIEVRDLCSLFLRENFPQLREEAKLAAEEHVREFTEKLASRLIDSASSIAVEKFRDPDVQSTINDAVQASARRGTAAHPDLLTSLIAERVSKHTNDFKDIVLSEAVQVVSKLTSQQISLLSFIHCIKSVRIRSISGVSDFEALGQAFLEFCRSSFGLSDAQKRHLQYAGVASINTIIGGKIFEHVRHQYKELNFPKGEEIKSAFENHAPSYLLLLNQFQSDQLAAAELTSVGQAIAITNMSRYLGRLNYEIWLQ
jgi:hypothetical protein